MEPHDIEHYLTELGTELSTRGIKKPVRMMLIGGAYKTRQQAQKLLERYILPEAREEHATQIEYSLNELFKQQETFSKERDSEQ